MTEERTIQKDDGQQMTVHLSEPESELWNNKPFEKFRRQELKRYLWAHSIQFEDKQDLTKDDLVRICESVHGTPKQLPKHPPKHNPFKKAEPKADEPEDKQEPRKDEYMREKLDGMNVPQLRKVVKELGMEDPGKSTKKKDLLDMIYAHMDGSGR